MDADLDNEHLLDEEEFSVPSQNRRYGSDYYTQICRSKFIRPIAVTEGIDFNSMTKRQRIKWHLQTFIQMISLIVLSVRTDRLWQPQYLKHHWLHYSGLLVITAVGWTPQVLDTLGPVLVGYSPIPRMSLHQAVPICIFGLLYYMLGAAFYMTTIAPYLRSKIGRSRTLKVWEYHISICWQVQTLGFWVLTIVEPTPFDQQDQTVPNWVTSTIGICFIALGIGFKFAAIYQTGYNTYYWYDMITHIPNAYFSEAGIYRYCPSPTYTLGRFTGFGVALQYRSLPIAVASVLDLVLISLFDRWVEQPFVKRMYIDKSIV